MFTFRRCVWSDVVSNEILFFFFFLLSWASCQREAVALPVELLWHVWGSCALVHRPTVQTAAWSSTLQTKNHRQADCGFDGQRKHRGPQKQTQTLRRYDRHTNSPLRCRINKNTDFHTLDWNHVCSLQTSDLYIQTSASEMVENPKWRPWLRFQRDMTIQRCNYMCCNAPLIIMVQRHIELL